MRTDAVVDAWRHIGRAWGATLALELGAARAELTAAEWGLADLPAAESAPIRREITLLRAVAYAYCDESIAGLAIVAQIAEGEGWPSRVATTICRFAYWRQRDFAALRRLRPASPVDRSRRRAALPAILDLSIEAAVAFEQLRLPIARRLALDAITLGEAVFGRTSAATALPASIAAELAYEEDNLDEAERLIGERLAAVRTRGDIESAIRSFAIMARVAARGGSPGIALQILDDARRLAERRGWPRLLAATLLQQIEIMLSCDRLEAAMLCVSHLDALASNPGLADYLAHREIRRFALIGRARVERSSAPSLRVVAMFRRLHQDAVGGHHRFHAVQLEVLLADSLAAVGEIDAALDVLRKALKTGATVGLYRVFLDGGETIRDLLQILHEESGIAGDWDESTLYLRSLLSHGVKRPNAGSVGGARSRHNSRISEREQAIVHLVGTGLPNKRIAEALGISPETVKTHIKNIFAKLSVTTRTEAVRRAQVLGLI